MTMNLIVISGATLLASGYLVILGNFFIAAQWWCKRRSGTMIPLVGSLLVLLGWIVAHQALSILFLVPLLFDLGGLPMFIALLVGKRKSKGHESQSSKHT